jgi:hypothetical protein
VAGGPDLDRQQVVEGGTVAVVAAAGDDDQIGSRLAEPTVAASMIIEPAEKRVFKVLVVAPGVQHPLGIAVSPPDPYLGLRMMPGTAPMCCCGSTSSASPGSRAKPSAASRTRCANRNPPSQTASAQRSARRNQGEDQEPARPNFGTYLA